MLALLASVSWGTGDFLGGTLSRKAHPLAVMRVTQGIALVGLALASVVAGELGETGAYGWGIGAGVCGVVGLGCFYAALAQGTMGIVAPVAATGAVIPVVISLAQGEAPTALQVLGIVVAVVGVVLASGPGRDGDAIERRSELRPLLLSGVAAVGFGLALTFVAEGSEHSVVVTLAVMRAVNVTISSVLILLIVRAAVRPTMADLPTLVLIAATDSGANLMYGFATRTSLVSVSAVLASLYPAVTALLAWRFHHEHLRRIQVAGVAATLTGVALMASGGT